MDTTPVADVCVSPDNKAVLFIAVLRGRRVHCSITREALEKHFWAPSGATSNDRLLKAYADGYKRIVAVAERKLLRSASESIRLDAADFSR
jgi:Protein of unknown function (DUF1488)